MSKTNMSKTKELFWTFFKIGAFTFGGGYAMVALLQNEFVEEKYALCLTVFRKNILSLQMY